jgi:hypothetical protein
MVNIGQVDSSPHMGEIVGYCYFFSNIWLSGTCTADARRSTLKYYTSIDPLLPKDVPFGGFNAKKLYLGSDFQITPISFLAGLGIPSLNVESNNFRSARPILVIRSSNDASPQKDFKYVGQTATSCFLGVNTKKTRQREFISQSTPFYNFLTTQPIHTNSNSIDAAGQVEHQTKLKHVKSFHLEKQFLRKFPQTEFHSQNHKVLKTFE